MATGSGDRLARGAVKAQFQATDGRMSDEKWSKAFDDFDPEAYKNKKDEKPSDVEPITR